MVRRCAQTGWLRTRSPERGSSRCFWLRQGAQPSLVPISTKSRRLLRSTREPCPPKRHPSLPTIKEDAQRIASCARTFAQASRIPTLAARAPGARRVHFPTPSQPATPTDAWFERARKVTATAMAIRGMAARRSRGPIPSIAAGAAESARRKRCARQAGARARAQLALRSVAARVSISRRTKTTAARAAARVPSQRTASLAAELRSAPSTARPAIFRAETNVWLRAPRLAVHRAPCALHPRTEPHFARKACAITRASPAFGSAPTAAAPMPRRS